MKMGIFSTIISIVVLFSSLSFIYTKVIRFITNRDETYEHNLLIVNQDVNNIMQMKNAIINTSFQDSQ